MNQQEADAIFNNPDKCIVEDIVWKTNPQHHGTLIFRETLYCNDLQLDIKGSINTIIDTISFTILHPTVGRIYALDHGIVAHKNYDGKKNGGLHKHRWRPEEPSFAYEPDDITATTTEYLKLWKEFCDEAKIYHTGSFFEPNLSGGMFDD